MADRFSKNIENYIGTINLPVGLAGPITINGEYANKDYLLPLATIEGALVASYNRGAKVISLSGGANTIFSDNAVVRVPAFKFVDAFTSQKFRKWLEELHETKVLDTLVSSTSNYCKLVSVKFSELSNILYVELNFSTGNAAGQNMVTLASQAIHDFIVENSPYKIKRSMVEANFSSDKKASYRSLLGVRGAKVSAEVFIPEMIVKEYLHSTVEDMAESWQIASSGASLSGMIGNQAHYANGIAALYLACGQDVACTAESAIGITRFEQVQENDAKYLYASVTMPNIIVGTVGGGSSLPSAKACLDLLGIDSKKPNSSKELAEIVAATCLAGEISLLAAITANQFTQAHFNHARRK